MGAPAIVLPDALANLSTEWVVGGAPGALKPAAAALAAVLVPVMLLSSAALLLGPGVPVVRAAAASRRGWLVALAIVIAACVLQVSIFTAAGHHPRLFAAASLALTAISAALSPRLFGEGDRAPVRLSWLHLFAPLGIAALLSGKVVFEDLNGDGAHALEATRLLLHQPWPFFDPAAGDVASFPGTTSALFTWPGAWFMRLFGEAEAAVRLPFLVYLGLLAAACQLAATTAGAGSRRSLPWLLWLSLTAFTVAIGYSATYSPYNADLALPATQDTLLVVVFVAFAIAMLERWWLLAVVFAALTHLSLPSGLILLAFWVAAQAALTAGHRVRTALAGTGVVVAAVGSVTLVGALAGAMGFHPGGEYGAGGLVQTFAILQLGDWRRFLYAALPAGIVPFLLLPWWRAQDTVARTFALVTLAYFAFFFVQHRVSLHHFVPAMLLPLVIGARMIDGRRWMAPAWAVGAVIALAASAPATFAISTVARQVGWSAVVDRAAYARSDAASFRAAEQLGALFGADWDASVPRQRYGGSPLVWNYYAAHRPADWPVAYRVTPDTVRVVDSAAYASHRDYTRITPAGAGVYHIPRAALFSGNDRRGRVDLRPILRSVGLLEASAP